jgi:hypothetical protein
VDELLTSIRYEPQWEADLTTHGLYGPNFDTFWEPIEASVIEVPDQGGVILTPTGQPHLSGAKAFVTDEAGFVDIPRLVVYFKYDPASRRLVFLGLDLAAMPDDYPPPDWA